MDTTLQLLPYPQSVEHLQGTLTLGSLQAETLDASRVHRLAQECLQRVLPKTGPPLRVRLASVAEDGTAGWIPAAEHSWLTADATSTEAYVLLIDSRGATIVGKSLQGMLYGAQTLVQLARQAGRTGSHVVPCMRIRDWPDLHWRCLSPSMTWYSGWNRLEGYDLNNWTLDEWKWLVDWSLEHKLNGWALCMYGYWPFTLPGYQEATLEVDSFRFDPNTGEKAARRFTHRNIEREFLPLLIAYARDRGIRMYA